SLAARRFAGALRAQLRWRLLSVERSGTWRRIRAAGGSLSGTLPECRGERLYALPVSGHQDRRLARRRRALLGLAECVSISKRFRFDLHLQAAGTILVRGTRSGRAAPRTREQERYRSHARKISGACAPKIRAGGKTQRSIATAPCGRREGRFGECRRARRDRGSDRAGRR